MARHNTNGDNADTIQVEINDNGNTGTGGGTNIDLGTVNVDITCRQRRPDSTMSAACPVILQSRKTFQ